MSGNLFSDDAVREIRRMFHEWRLEDRRLPRNNRPATRPAYPREDMVLYQASSTGTLPAVTASTTGVTPGKITTAKQLTIDSSGNAVPCNTARDLTIYNMGSGVGAASHVGEAHREFKTGRWVAKIPSAGKPECFTLTMTQQTGTSTNGFPSPGGWEIVGLKPMSQHPASSFSWVSFSTSGSTDASEVITFNESQTYLIHVKAEFDFAQQSSTDTLWRHTLIDLAPYVLTNGDSIGTGDYDGGRIRYEELLPPTSVINAGSNEFQATVGTHFLYRPSTGTRLHWRWGTGVLTNRGPIYGNKVQQFRLSIMPVND